MPGKQKLSMCNPGGQVGSMSLSASGVRWQVIPGAGATEGMGSRSESITLCTYLQLAIVPLVFAQKSVLPEAPEPAWDSLSAVQTACINDKLHAVGR